MTSTEQTTTTLIPDALKILKPMKIWALYRNTADKAPYCVDFPDRHASPTDPRTWTDGARAEASAKRNGCTGFHIATGKIPGKHSHIVAVDLDHVRNATTGEIQPDAMKVIETLNSYTEASASGTGVHILLFADPEADMKAISKKPGAFGDTTALEIFAENHFCGVTGQQIRPGTIAMRTAELKEVYSQYDMPRKTAEAETGKPLQHNSEASKMGYGLAENMTDDELITLMLESDEKVAGLWNGKYGDDHSGADLALCNRLAYWCNADPERMDRLFRQSGLMRPKWDRKAGHGKTYGQGTIEEALKDIKPFDYSEWKKTHTENPQTVQRKEQPAQQVREDPKAEPVQEAPKAEPEPLPDYSVGAYLRDQFLGDICLFKSGANRRTGIEVIDQKISALRAGLYTLTASPGCGKSTLLLNIAVNLAEQGEAVMFFSLEMTPFELVAKILSRETGKEYGATNRNALTHTQIMDGVNPTEIWGRIEHSRTMQAVQENLYIVPAELNMDIDRIIEICEQFTEKTGKTPIVVVDYLQIIQPKDGRSNEMESINYTIRRLKQYQMKSGNVVFVVSSTARSNYDSTGGLATGKGSGTIEYTANFAWFLSFRALSNLSENDRYTKAKDRDAKAEIKEQIKREEMQKTPRKLILSCSKARGYQSGWTVNLDFYGATNMFVSSKD